MIRITIQALPQGDESRATHVATIDAWDVSTHDEVSDYNFAVREKAAYRQLGSVIGHVKAGGWRDLVMRIGAALCGKEET